MSRAANSSKPLDFLTQRHEGHKGFIYRNRNEKKLDFDISLQFFVFFVL